MGQRPKFDDLVADGDMPRFDDLIEDEPTAPPRKPLKSIKRETPGIGEQITDLASLDERILAEAEVALRTGDIPGFLKKQGKRGLAALMGASNDSAWSFGPKIAAGFDTLGSLSSLEKEDPRDFFQRRYAGWQGTFDEAKRQEPGSFLWGELMPNLFQFGGPLLAKAMAKEGSKEALKAAAKQLPKVAAHGATAGAVHGVGGTEWNPFNPEEASLFVKDVGTQALAGAGLSSLLHTGGAAASFLADEARGLLGKLASSEPVPPRALAAPEPPTAPASLLEASPSTVPGMPRPPQGEGGGWYHPDPQIAAALAREQPTAPAAFTGMFEEGGRGHGRPLQVPPPVDLHRQGVVNEADRFHKERGYIPGQPMVLSKEMRDKRNAAIEEIEAMHLDQSYENDGIYEPRTFKGPLGPSSSETRDLAAPRPDGRGGGTVELPSVEGQGVTVRGADPHEVTGQMLSDTKPGARAAALLEDTSIRTKPEVTQPVMVEEFTARSQRPAASSALPGAGRSVIKRGELPPPGVPALDAEPPGLFASRAQAQAAFDAARAAEAVTLKDPRAIHQPGPAIEPGGLPPGITGGAEVAEARNIFSQFARRDGVVARVARELALPEFRAAQYVVPGIRGWEAARAIEGVQVAKVHALLRRVEKQLQPEQRKLVERFIRQRVSPERLKFEQVIPVEAMPPEFRLPWQQAMDQMNAQRADLLKAGVFDAETMKRMNELESQGVAWLHRDYRAHMDKRFKPNEAHLENALRFLQKDGKMTPTEAAAAVAELLGSFTEGSPQQRWARSRINKEIFKGRQEIPAPLRKVMGEVNSPAYAVAVSMGEIERAWRQLKVSQTFTTPDLKGKVWSDVASPNMATARIPNDKRAYGEFAGKYLAPELYEAVMQAPQQRFQSALLRFLAWGGSLFKTAKVALSPITYLVNGISNTTNMAAAGLPMWHRRAVPRVTQATRALLSYNRQLQTPNAKTLGEVGKNEAQWFQWAMEDGAIKPGLGAEAGGSEARALAERYLRDPASGILGVFQKAWDLGGQGKAKLGGLYDAMDSIPKLAVYIEQVTRATEAGMPLNEARSLASKIINENFVSSANIGPAVKSAAQLAGVVNPFMSWHADNIRVHLNWLRNAGKGFGPGGALSGQGSSQAFNVALQYGLIAGLFSGARYLAGMNDGEVAAGEALLKTGYGRNTPLRQWLPFRDAMDRLQVVNLRALFPTEVFLRGDPNTNILVRVLRNTLMGLVQGAGGEDIIGTGLAAVGLHEDEFKKPEPMQGDEQRAALEAVWNYIEPGIVRDARNIARRTQMAGELRRFEEPLTPGQALSKVAGFAVEPVGERSALGEMKRSNARIRSMDGERKRVNVQETQGDLDPRRAAEMRKKQNEEKAKVRRESSQRSKAIRRGQ